MFIFCTLPGTVACGERVFSDPKLIKTYLSFTGFRTDIFYLAILCLKVDIQMSI